MNKPVALVPLFAGTAFVVGAYNPIEPNLHPNSLVVCSGAIVAAIGAYLFAFKVTPREPGFRAAGLCVIVGMVGLSLMSLLF